MKIKAYTTRTVTLGKDAIFTIFKEFVETKLGDTLANVEWVYTDGQVTSCQLNMVAQPILL